MHILNDLHVFASFSREEIVLRDFVIIGNTYSALNKLSENNVISGTYGEFTSSSLISFFCQGIILYSFITFFSGKTYIATFKLAFQKQIDEKKLEDDYQ